ncbi:MAG: TrkH family potassium uptake protein [Clostridiaceae bacterium]
MNKVEKKHDRNRVIAIQPTRLIVLSFALVILTGTLLLLLPSASRDGKGSTLIEALFTATSATCVTGLVVVDTYQHWSTFGQIIIISLIQVGGLGLITFVTFFSSMLGRKMRIKSMVLAQESINYFSIAGIRQLVMKIVLVTLSIEFTGALLLSTSFVPQYGVKGFYLGFFHSISAFCNAGFDLMSISGAGQYLSLIQYNNDTVVIYTVASLIVIGGLGFVVWKDLYEYRKSKYLMLHTKLVLIMTAILIVLGSILFFVFESQNPATMAKLNLAGKINASIFQSVTPRTAGFNTIDLNGMKDISKLLSIILMFIGAAPGSTGGGIKVTTFGILLFAILSQLKGSDEIVIFKRRVSFSTVSKALAIMGLSLMLVLVVSAIIQIIEDQPMINVLFETTSAFGTVGLTTGLTPGLHNISKLLLILLMYLGRVGPVSFALALATNSHKNDTDIIYPEGKVIVG